MLFIYATQSNAQQPISHAMEFIKKINEAVAKGGDALFELLFSVEDTDEIVDALTLANEAYRNTDKTLMTDRVYDDVEAYLRKRDPEHPFLLKVGAVPATTAAAKGKTVTLPFYMGSLNKIRDDDTAVQKWIKQYPGPVVISDKLDGLSGLLHYKNGKITLMSSGDGTVCLDWSQMLPYIKPATSADIIATAAASKVTAIAATATTAEFAIRGELIISRANWEHIKHLGANPRNVVSGCMIKKIPKPEIANRIDFVGFELVYPNVTPEEGLAFLKKAGFKTVYNKTYTALTSELLDTTLHDRRANSPYEVDGIVIYQNKRNTLVSGENPKYAFAYKSIHTHEEAIATVTEVIWNVSKDGYIKPTVKFPVIKLAGVSITNATGFNAGFIEKHVIGPGAQVAIIRSGDVIPHIVRVVKPATSGRPALPDPEVTQYHYQWTTNHVDIILNTDEDAVANVDQTKSILESLVKKLNILGVGPGIITKMVDAGIDTIPKFMNVTMPQVLALEGFKERSASKVVEAIHASRDTALCMDLMVASNIFGRGLGHRKIEAILKVYPSVLDRSKPLPTVADVTKVNGIGPETATLFIEQVPKFFKILDEIGIPCRVKKAAAPAAAAAAPAANKNKKSVVGMTIVFTGFRNKDWQDIVEERGGKIGSSVSSKTSLIVTNDPDENTGKLSKARELKIPIMSTAVFEKTYI